MLTVKPLRCINTLWLGVYVRYTPWNILDIPQQNPLKYGFSGIEYMAISPAITSACRLKKCHIQYVMCHMKFAVVHQNFMSTNSYTTYMSIILQLYMLPIIHNFMLYGMEYIAIYNFSTVV